MAVLGIANQAGAPLLAAALAFNAMFAILPGLLLLSGILGWAIEDVEARARLLTDLLARIPALGSAISDSLDGVVRERGGLTIIGLVGLVWGASNFYGVLDEVMRRIFAGGAVRGFLEQRIRGLLTVMGLIVLTFGTILLGGLATVAITTVGELPGLAIALSVAGPLGFIGFSIVAVLFTYLFVPTAPPSLRAAWLPAVVAGTGIGLLTSLFSLLAPLLVGGLAAFGVLAAVFGALVWLNFGFQMLLWGAAWARYRRDRVSLAAYTDEIG
jgi:YihY family inner membrane protein